MDGTSFGRYRLLGLLGEGGMGQVYRAYDSGTDRVVALKVLSQHLANDAKFRERFRREAHAVARLSDPHVIPIHDYGEIDGRLYLNMRLVEGRDVAALLADGPIAKETAVDYVRQVGSALDAAHRAGIVHRDVKPSNILVTADDFAYLIDFGIAVGSGDTSLTTTGAAIGSFAYTAPERFLHGACDGRSDVYSLTCVLYQCLTGAQPFPGASVEQLITAHLHVPPPRPSESAAVPAAFDAVVARGMAKKADDRYRTGSELAAAARAALATPTRSGSPQPSRLAATQVNPASQPQQRQQRTRQPQPPQPRTQRPGTPEPVAQQPRNRNRPAVVWTGVLVVAAVIGWWAVSGRGDRESPPANPTSVTCVTARPTSANPAGVPTAPPLGPQTPICPPR